MLVTTMHDFVLPVQVPVHLKALDILIVTAILLVGIELLYKRHAFKYDQISTGSALLLLCALFSLTYVGFLIVSVSFVDAHTPLDSRILSPAFLTTTIASIGLAWSVWKNSGIHAIWYAAVFVMWLSVGLNGSRALAVATDLHENGYGYTSRDWRDSQVISFLEAVDQPIVIYSNGSDAIRFLTGKDALTWPHKTSPISLSVNPDYGPALHRMCQECREGVALVIHFNATAGRWYLPSREELELLCDLPVLGQFSDGVVYGKIER
jgi:hypothetical protein